MKKSLLGVISASERRKEVLLLLQDGAGELESIISSLNTTRNALFPQMRILEEHTLISNYKDTYKLNDI